MAAAASIFKPSLNWLMIFVPLAIVAEIAHAAWHSAWATPTLIFACSAVAIIPMAGWMGRATEHLATRLGEGVGGLLNATLGNAAELIIALMMLIEARRHPEKLEFLHNVVKASVTGSIIGNVLLVLGAALLVGGLKHRVQKFNPTAARAAATLLTLAMIALFIPALFAHLVPGKAALVNDLSLEFALILLAVYVLSLVFTLHTHKHLYVGRADDEATIDEQHQHWSVGKSLMVMLAATVGVGVLAEFMVGSVEEASKAVGLSEIFVGIVVVAIVGNAAEHSTAVLVAFRNRMDLAMTISLGSSIQVALLIAPLLVLVSQALGTPMSFVYTVPEVLAVGLTVLIAEQIAGDGESHWLEGVLLLTVYALLAIMFFHLPA